MAVSLVETAIRIGVPCPFLSLGASLLNVIIDIEHIIRRGVLLFGVRYGVVGISPARVVPSVYGPRPSVGGWFLFDRALHLVRSKFFFGLCIIRGLMNCIL